MRLRCAVHGAVHEGALLFVTHIRQRVQLSWPCWDTPSSIEICDRPSSGEDNIRTVQASSQMNPGPLGSALGCSFLSCALQEAIEARATDSKNLRGADAVAVAHFKDALNMDSANFIKRQRTPILFGGRDRAARLLQMSGEIGNVNEIGAGSESGA